MKPRDITVLVVAVVVALAAFSGAGMADYGSAPSVDTSPTDDTSTTSNLQDGDTLGGDSFNANSSKDTILQFISDSNKTKVKITPNGSDAPVIYANTSAVQVNWNTTDNDGHFNVSINHGDLAGLEHTMGENVTVDVTMVNNTTASDPATTTIQVNVDWDNGTTTENVDDADVSAADIVEVTNDSNEELPFTSVNLPLTGEEESRVELDNREVNGSATDVVLVLSNTTVADDFASAADGADTASKLSSISFERTAILVESEDTTEAVPVFYESAPSDLDNELRTYALYTSDYGGEQAVVIKLGDEFDDASQVDVTAVGSAGFSTFMFDYAMSGASNIFPATLDASLVGMVVFAAPGRRRGGQGPAALAGLSNSSSATSSEVRT